MKMLVPVCIVTFALGVWVDARFAANRFTITEEGCRLDTRTGEVTAFTPGRGVEVVLPAK